MLVNTRVHELQSLWLCNVLLLLLLVSSRQGKRVTTTSTNPGQNHIGAQRNIKDFNKVLGKEKETNTLWYCTVGKEKALNISIKVYF